MNSTATTTDATLTPNRKQPSQKQELIAANVKALIEQLKAGHSDALTAYLNAISRFHTYSCSDSTSRGAGQRTDSRDRMSPLP